MKIVKKNRNRNKNRKEIQGLSGAESSPWGAVYALFRHFCELNVHIFVRNFCFVNFSNSIHDSAVVSSSEDSTKTGVGFSKDVPAEVHGYLAR